MTKKNSTNPYSREDKESFIIHIRKTSKEIADTWPKWKKELIESSAPKTEKVG